METTSLGQSQENERIGEDAPELVGLARDRRPSMAAHTRPDGRGRRLALGLGWFSLALGLAQVAAPRQMARLIGVRTRRPGLIRAVGLREIGHGVTILTQRGRTAGVWSRV